MQIADLPSVEQKALGLLLQGDDVIHAALRRQMSSIKKVNRTETGAGVYVIFELEEAAVSLEDKSSFHLADVYATSARCDEVGFILFVKEGLIDYLEGYTYSDEYPSYDDCAYSVSYQPT